MVSFLARQKFVDARAKPAQSENVCQPCAAVTATTFDAHGGNIPIGSDAHLALFCNMLLDTHNPYKPAVLDWPKLDDEARDRLVSLPIWDMAVQTEGRASVKVMAYLDYVDDPLLKRAIEMDGFEEARHKRVLHNLVEAYGIALAPEPDYPKPRDGEWAFMTIGYSECIDSFFAFGLFALAKRSGFFPPELVETFEPVMQEEARHILFFRNWVAWHRARLTWWRKIVFDVRRVAVFIRLVWQRAMIARGAGGNNFTATGHQSMGIDVKIGDVLDTCLAENDRRMAGYDARLLHPTLVPRAVRFARHFV
jgi:hypothetical protein